MCWLDREIVCLGFLGSEDQAGGLATFRERETIFGYGGSSIQQGWINWDRNEKM